MKQSSIPLSGVLLLALVSPAIQAEYTLNELLDMDLEQLMDISVVTASRYPVELRQVPGMVRVVTARQIRDRGYRHLGELLADQPGIQVQRASTHEYWNRIAINGVNGNNKFLILQDGVRINSPTGEPVPVDYNFSLYHLQRVEIVYGPTSALYGADAVSGVINLITRTPGGRQGEVAVAVGESDSRYAHLVASEQLAEKFAVSLGGHVQRRDGQDLKPIYDSTDPNTGFGSAGSDEIHLPTESYSMNLRLDAGDHYKLMYNESQFSNSTHTSGEVDVENYAAEANYIQLLRTLAVEGNWQLSDAWSFVLRANHSEYEVDPDSRYINTVSATTVDGIGWKYAEGRRNQIEPYAIWKSDTNVVTFGASYEDYYSLPQTADLDYPYDGSQAVTSLDYLSRGVYAEWHAHWGESLQTALGLRYDHPSDSVSNTSPRLNIVYLTGANTVWRLGYSEAFLSPAPFFRFKEYPGFVPNPDLLPEKMRALDLGWQREWTNNLDLNVVAYRLLLEDVIYRTIGGTTVNPDSNQNLGTLDNTGVNLALNWTPSAGYEYWLSAGYIDGHLENIDPMQPSSEYPVLFTSRWHGSLGMTWSGKRYTVTPSLEFADRADGGFAAVNEGGSSPGYGLVNLFVRMHNVLVKNGEVTLKIQNVFDRRWYQPGLGRMDFSAVPQETRNIMLGYTWRY